MTTRDTKTGQLEVAKVAEVVEVLDEAERFDPKRDGPDLAYEHIHRYMLASRALSGLKVLDLASGSGFGSRILREGGASVTSLDLDFTSFNPTHSGICGNALALPFCDESFDAVVCFEAIEHVDEPARLVADVRRVLRDPAIFLVSSPDRSIYSTRAGHENPFHVAEMNYSEFNQLLRKEFSSCRILGQGLWAGSWIAGLAKGGKARGLGKRRLESLPLDFDFGDRTLSRATWADPANDDLPTPVYMLALCADSKSGRTLLSENVPPETILHDRSQWLLGQYEKLTIAWGEELQDFRTQLDAARVGHENQAGQIEQARRTIDDYELRSADVRRTIDDLEAQLAKAQQNAQTQESEIAANLEQQKVQEEALANAANEFDRLTSEVDAARRAIDAQSVELDAAKRAANAQSTEIDSARATMGAQVTEIESARNTIDAQANELAEAQRAADTQSAEIASAKTAIDSQATELATARDNADAQSSALSVAREGADDQERELQRQRESLARLAAASEDAEASREVTAQELESALWTVNQLLSTIQDLEAELLSDRNGQDDLESQIDRARSTITEYETQIANARESIDRYEEQITNARETAAQYEDQISTARTTVTQLEEEISTARESVSQYEGQIAAAQEASTQYEDQIARARDAAVHAEEAAGEARDTARSQAAEIENLRADLVEATSRNSELEETLGRFFVRSGRRLAVLADRLRGRSS